MKLQPDPRRFLLVLAAVGAGALFWWSRSDREIVGNAGANDLAHPGATKTVADGRPTAAPTRARENSAPPLRGHDSASLNQRLQAVLALPQTSERRQALEDLAGALARIYPERAADLLRGLQAERGEASPDAYAFVSGFMADYAAADPRAAAAWAAELPLSLQFSASGFVAQHWAKKDLAAATKWAENLSDPSLRVQVLRRIGQELEGGAGNPGTVATWAQRLAGSADANQHTELISRLWARNDVQGAFAWSAQIEDPVRRAAAVVAIAGAVAEESPQVAGAWVAQFPPGDMRNQAVAVASAKWSEKDPAAAAKWVASLGDAQLLESSIRAIGVRWLQNDRAAASEWIRSAPISPGTISYLLGPDP